MGDRHSSLNDCYLPCTYVVVDLETTGLSITDSIVEIAAAKFENGTLADTFETLVNPLRHIPMAASNVNNIFDDMVADAPTITDVIGDFCDFIGELPLVGHNVGYDYGYIYRACKRSGIRLCNAGVDTLAQSKNLFPELHSHTLKTLCQYLGIENQQAHRALSDVGATAELYEICKEYYLSGVKPKTYPLQSKRRYPQYSIDLASIRPTVEPSESSPLYGKAVVFTGEMSIPRDEAAQLAVNAGAIVKTSMSKKVDFLVVGTQDTALVGIDGLSSKEEKAIDYNNRGLADIRFINEQEFVRMLSVKEVN